MGFGHRGVTKHRSMQDWLGSKAPGSGGGGKFLSGWKDFKKGTGEVDTWLHTACLPMTVWRHPFPMIIVVEDKQTKEKVAHVWARNHTCHETEDVLDKLYWREERGVPSSARSAPPERCGVCKFAEFLWQGCWSWLETHDWEGDGKEGRWVEGAWSEDRKRFKAKAGKGRGIDPCAVVFRFVSEADDDENTTIHAGGFCGLFGRDELPEHLLKAMSAAKIRQKEAWKESCMVKPKSVMCVVDNAHPEKGVQISEETKELGEKVKEEITRVWKSQEVDIQRKPYAIKWEYDKSKNMGKQYAATAMLKIKPDERILKAIRGPAPDLSNVETPFEQQTFRALFELHCKLEKGSVPWDEIFPTPEQEKKWKAEDAAAADDAEPEEEDEEDADAGEPEEDDAEKDDDGDELVGCDACGKPMKISAARCPHCKKDYSDGAEPEEPEPPKMRSRSEAKKAKTEEASPKRSAKKKDEEEEDDEDESDQDDEIPFDQAPRAR